MVREMVSTVNVWKIKLQQPFVEVAETILTGYDFSRLRIRIQSPLLQN